MSNEILIAVGAVHLIFGFIFAGAILETGSQRKEYGIGVFLAVVSILIPFSWAAVWLIGFGAKLSEPKK
jgi:hypothetical protein